MRIIHITPVFLPYRAGMVTAVHTQARELVQRGHDVFVLTPKYDSFWHACEIVDDVSVRRVGSLLAFGNGAFVPKMYFELCELLSRSTDGEDIVVHVHTPFFGGQEVVWFARLFGILRHIPLVIQYHHDPQLTGITRLLSVPSRLVFSALMRSADRVVVSSLDYARHSTVARVIDGRFVEVPFGVDSRRFMPRGEWEKEKAERSGLNILFVGALDRAHHFKGLSMVLRAIKELPVDCQLLVVGAGNLLDGYKKQAQELGIADRVVFYGFVSDDDLPRHYQDADVFVFPSTGKAEAFGLVALEAMSSGLPVIASDLPGVRSLIDDTSMLVQPEDSEALARQFTRLLNDAGLRDTIGRQNRGRVLSCYSLEVATSKLERVYQSILNSK